MYEAYLDPDTQQTTVKKKNDINEIIGNLITGYMKILRNYY